MTSRGTGAGSSRWEHFPCEAWLNHRPHGHGMLWRLTPELGSQAGLQVSVELCSLWCLQTAAQGKPSPEGSPRGSISLYQPVPRAASLNIWGEHLGPAAERAPRQTNPPIDSALAPSCWNWLEWSPGWCPAPAN